MALLLLVPSGHGRRRLLLGSPITTKAGVEAKEVSARGAGTIASSVLGIEAAA